MLRWWQVVSADKLLEGVLFQRNPTKTVTVVSRNWNGPAGCGHHLFVEGAKERCCSRDTEVLIKDHRL